METAIDLLHNQNPPCLHLFKLEMLVTGTDLLIEIELFKTVKSLWKKFLSYEDKYKKQNAWMSVASSFSTTPHEVVKSYKLLFPWKISLLQQLTGVDLECKELVKWNL